MNVREIYKLEIYYVDFLKNPLPEILNITYVENVDILSLYLKGSLVYLDLFETFGYVFGEFIIYIDINNLNSDDERVLFYKNWIVNYKRIQKLKELNGDL